MEVYDSHIHLNSKLPLKQALDQLRNNLDQSNVSGGFLLHVDTDPWSFRDLATAITDKRNLFLFKNVNPNHSAKRLDLELSEIIELKAEGIKLHPRRHEFHLEHKNLSRILNCAAESELIVNVCTFFDGSWSRFGLTVDQHLHLADKFPNVRFIWSHSGGHKILDFLFMARRTQNVYLDSSFTQTYFFRGRVREDLLYAIESLPSRFLFGSDIDMNEYYNKVPQLVANYVEDLTSPEDFLSVNLLRLIGRV